MESSSLHEVLLYKEDNEFCTSILAERATKNHQGCNRRASSIVVVLPPAHGGMFATSVKPSDGFKIRATPERLYANMYNTGPLDPYALNHTSATPCRIATHCLGWPDRWRKEENPQCVARQSISFLNEVSYLFRLPCMVLKED